MRSKTFPTAASHHIETAPIVCGFARLVDYCLVTCDRRIGGTFDRSSGNGGITTFRVLVRHHQRRGTVFGVCYGTVEASDSELAEYHVLLFHVGFHATQPRRGLLHLQHQYPEDGNRSRHDGCGSLGYAPEDQVCNRICGVEKISSAGERRCEIPSRSG